MIQIQQYQPSQQAVWNDFVSTSRNGTFLFNRGYMDYHADRFQDHSVTFEREGSLLAVMPANIVDETMITHGGLTFGGIVLSRKVGASDTLKIFEALMDYLQKLGLKKLVYKPLPHIYHHTPSEDDLYALYRLGGKATRVDLSTTIDMQHRMPFAKGRKHALGKAKKANIDVRESDDYDSFWHMLAENLDKQHQAKPTHSLVELILLSKRFSEIKLYMAYLGDKPIAGVLIYDYGQVAHTQYIALTDESREVGGVDIIISTLLNDVYQDKRFFNFGISTCKNGNYFNEGLAKQKEMFGGRSTVLQWMEVSL